MECVLTFPLHGSYSTQQGVTQPVTLGVEGVVVSSSLCGCLSQRGGDLLEKKLKAVKQHTAETGECGKRSPACGVYFT